MYCGNCGHQNPPEADFCGNCGAKLVTEVEPATPPAPVPPQAPKKWLLFGGAVAVLAITGIIVGFSLLSDGSETTMQTTSTPTTARTDDLTGIPGDTIADLQLQQDVLEMLVVMARAGDFDCTTHEVINTEVTEITAVDSPWVEHWTLNSCGVNNIFEVRFTPDGLGGTLFSISRVDISPATITPPPTDTTLVIFPDENLESAIRETINKPDDPIYQHQLETLSRLEASGRGISDLTGIEYCINLVDLHLDGNNISDILPLAGLTNLVELTIADNNISNISPLASLTDLSVLILDNNNISDISPLGALINLEVLYLWENNITDISSLAGLTNLYEIDLSANNISNISPLASLANLQLLFLWENNVSNISPLSNLGNLEILILGENNISDISPLTALTKLQDLDLMGNNVNDVSPLIENSGLSAGDYVDLRFNPLSNTSVNIYISQLEQRGVTVEWTQPSTTPLTDTSQVAFPDANLETTIRNTIKKYEGPIYISDLESLTSLDQRGTYRDISDLTGLEYCANLEYIYINQGSVSDLSPISKLTKMRFIAIVEANISDLSSISGLYNLEELILAGNPITDISPLADLINLKDLILGANNISDISPLANLTNLQDLNLQNNNISDISPLANLTNLSRCRLSSNNISDISPLVDNNGISQGDEVFLTGNPLSMDSINVYIPQLEAKGVTVEWTPPATSTNTTQAVFPDVHLEAAIRETLNKPEGPIYISDIEPLTILEANERDISDITGLEYCVNLEVLRIYKNNIKDISPIAMLTNLRFLDLCSNRISDLLPLSDLTNLGWINLGDNNITDTTPLAGLINLYGLSIWGNNIIDLSPLSDLTNLNSLYISQNNIIDISPLEGLIILEVLSLWGNNISDISPLAILTNLDTLNLYQNNISDISPLVENSGLSTGDTIDLGNNPLSTESINVDIPQLIARGVEVTY